jgi:hypothetical protein
MNAGNLAALIESYLEADDSGNGAANGSASHPDAGARQQLQALSQKTDQLRQDTTALQKQVASIKNNMQMAALLPMLMNQSLAVVSDTLPNNTAGNLQSQEVIEFQQSDPLTALLPVLLMGGMGDSSNGGGDNSSNMLMVALAVAGKL